MFKKIFLLSLITCSIPSYTKISDIPIYPSGIKVKFQFPIQEENKKKKRKEKKRKEKDNTPIIMTNSETDTSVTNTKQFIRIINAVQDLTNNEQLALVFFNKEDQVVEYYTVTNTEKPSPTYIFFMDKQTGSRFQGKLDTYFIPKDAYKFNIAVVDKKGKIISETTHPSYQNNKGILVEDYYSMSSQNKIMLQLEILGSAKKLVTRISAFRF